MLGKKSSFMNMAAAIMGAFLSGRSQAEQLKIEKADLTIPHMRYGQKDRNSTSGNRLSQKKRRIQARRKASN